MRTDADTVKGILTTALTDGQIETHINIASRMVDVRFSSSSLSEETLTDIETYLTAHLIAIGKERQALDEKIGDVQVKFQGQFTQGLKLTTYGQMVLTLDTTGAFANEGKRRVTIKAIGQVNQDTL